MAFAVPDLAGFAAAALLLVLAVAIGLLASLLANTLGNAPVIGGWVSRDLVGWLTDARNGVLKAADATWHFATGMVNWLTDITTKPLIYLGDFAIRVWNDVQTLKDVTIPDALNSAANYAASARQAAEVYAAAAVSAVSHDLAADLATAEARAAQLTAGAETYAAGLVSAAERDLSAAIAAVSHAESAGLSAAELALTAGISSTAATAYRDLAGLAGSTDADIARLAADITAEGQAVAAGAQAALAAVQGGIYTDLETWGDRAVSQAWPDALQDIQSLRNTLGEDFPWLADLAGALAGAGAAGLLGALIRSIAGTQAIVRLADDCIVPNCRNLSGLGNDLAELAGLAATAAMLAWGVFLVTDPAGWAQDTYDLGGPVVTDITNGAARLFGAA
jgi:hypothetical protein